MTELILIGGMPRSGTSIVIEYINKNFEVSALPETHLLHALYNAKRLRTSLNHQFNEMDILIDDELRTIASEIDSKIKTYGIYKKFLHVLKRYATVKHGTNVLHPIVEKTPRHIQYFEDIISKKEILCMIVVRRNGFEVLQSLEEVSWNNETRFKNFRRWFSYLRIANRLKRLSKDKVITVDYHKFCERPELYNNQFCKFMQPRKRASDSTPTFNPRQENWKKNALRDPFVNKKSVKTLSDVVYLVLSKLLMKLF